MAAPKCSQPYLVAARELLNSYHLVMVYGPDFVIVLAMDSNSLAPLGS